jgi:hypothetical protein
MKSLTGLLLAGSIWAACAVSARAADLSVQGITQGISYAQVEALKGPDYVYSLEAEMDNMPGKVYTAIKGPNEGFMLFFLHDHLQYLQYEVFYPQGGMPNLEDFRKALAAKYGDNGGAFHWDYDQKGTLLTKSPVSCDIADDRQQPMAFHHRGNSNLKFSIPRQWRPDCFSHVDVEMGADPENPKLVAWYQVVMADEGAVTDFLSAQAMQQKKDADAAAALAAKKNAPKL